jgi:hypothetical protein
VAKSYFKSKPVYVLKCTASRVAMARFFNVCSGPWMLTTVLYEMSPASQFYRTGTIISTYFLKELNQAFYFILDFAYLPQQVGSI